MGARDKPGHDEEGQWTELTLPPSQIDAVRDKAIDDGPALRFNCRMTFATNHYYWFTTSHTGGAQGFV